ncbi:protein zwilch homolog isoform X1 [Maylandia zebra]|uniref:Protein zwilch n=1 Tax=Astatotilapia calliptera TaxID=8154 RepID=A0A3P8PZW7_ASTCA|nr:protein zwilch homolog isoform X1 [Maylandia zebra]XP_026031610.1 protein zwilch homolog isoform X1 [Astatotilapia calliptera]
MYILPSVTGYTDHNLAMCSKIISRAKEFFTILRSLQDAESSDPYIYEEEVQIVKMNGDGIPAVNMYCGNQTVFVCEKAVSKISDPGDEQMTEASNLSDGDADDANDSAHVLQTEMGPQPLSVMKARQFLSWYTLSQNASMSAEDTNLPLYPLWVRCDMSDPAGTTWFGAETVCVGTKVTGVKLYSITSKGSTADKQSLTTLEELKQEHKKRHHPSSVGIKGSARFSLFGSTVVENTTIESQSSVTVDFKWSHVESILETPPLSSTATLNIKIASGDMRSPMFEMYRELEFLLTLADGLRTGETEWMEPLESTSPVNLTKAYLEELQNTAKTLQDQAARTPEKTSKLKSETETPIFNSFLERGDLDFVEQLWVRMRKSVTSYQDIGDCLKLVIDALRYGDIKPWIHRDSSSSLSKLILQSYHQQIEHVSLTGFTPVNMLLEMGLDKMRKDYINYLIGEELTTLNHLCFYLSTEVDLQEQVIRLRKLHHLLEIIVTCSTFLGLPYDRLFLLTQLCLQHYRTSPYDEEHEFKLQIKPALISHFYQKEHPILWGVEVSSGHGPREVRTSLHLSDRPLVDHVIFETDYPNETVNGDSEDPAFFSTMAYCSLVNFA